MKNKTVIITIAKMITAMRRELFRGRNEFREKLLVPGKLNLQYLKSAPGAGKCPRS
jgi:hypothetical protein